MVECGVCLEGLEEYQEGDLELHREMCVVWLMFRCSLCGEDYVSKEGLWNHLDLHEIADESKELHYREVKAKHKLHQCVLCNDQRAYLESPYWKHIHDVHDGFSLRCSNCEESFRSEKLKNDHASSHCNARYQVVASDVNVLQEEQVPVKVENLTSNAEHLKLLLEIKVEETMLQELEDQVLNEVPGRSFDPALTSAVDYVPVKTCSFEDAELFVKNFEFGFGVHTKSNNKKGSNRYYRCMRLKKRVHPQCTRKMWIFTPNKNEKSTVCAKGEHSCMNAPPENIAVNAHVNFGYVPVRTCYLEDAKSFVENFEFGFGFNAKQDKEKGNMRYYRCKRVKFRARPQCERKVLICTPNINEKSTVCVKGEHSCINAPRENLTASAQIDLGYVPVKTCSLEDAKSFVKNFEFGFACLSETDKGIGITRYYRCSRVGRKVRPQCKRKVLIFTPGVNEESMVCATGEHSCINAPPEHLTANPQIGLGYVPVETCSFEDAKLFVKNFEFGFGFITTKKNRGIRYYRCLRVKRKVRPQCERKALIFTPNINAKSMVCAKGEHSCLHAPPENLTRAKLSVEQADITRKLLMAGGRKKDFKDHTNLLEANVSKRQFNHAVRNASKRLAPHDGKSMDVQTGDTEDLDKTIKVKEEYPEDAEEIITEEPNTTESAECHEVPSDRIEPLERPEVMDVH